MLAHTGARFTLVDAGTVSVFNPSRQWFALGEVGEIKARALAARLPGTGHRGVNLGVEDATRSRWESLVTMDPPDLAVLATGTHHHGMLAESLRQRAIPHVVTCCYPRARYGEVSVVSPADHTPCLACFRGHLDRGAPAAAPMDDELAAFIYAAPDDREREARMRDLVAEPATQVETMRVALVAARCAAQLLAPRRQPWMERMTRESTTCLLVGNHAERTSDGEWAYGIETPGQVIRLGLEDLTGWEQHLTCGKCGRVMPVTAPCAAPELPDEAWVISAV